MVHKLEEMIKVEMRKRYHRWIKGGHEEWVALDEISEMFENHDDFDNVSFAVLQEAVRKEMESL